MNTVFVKEKGTGRVLEQKRFRPNMPLPQRHDHINIGNAKWCVDNREFTEESSFDGPILTIIIWVYDDSRLH